MAEKNNNKEKKNILTD